MTIFKIVDEEIIETNNYEIDIPVVEEEDEESSTVELTKFERFCEFISNLYIPFMNVFFGFATAIIIFMTIMFIGYAINHADGNAHLTIVTSLTNDEGTILFKGWEITPALQKEIDNGQISLKDIQVITDVNDGNITFNGNYSDKIAIVSCRVEIENNDPHIYSEEYFQELVNTGKNIYTVKTLGLVTETKKEDAQ